MPRLGDCNLHRLHTVGAVAKCNSIIGSQQRSETGDQGRSPPPPPPARNQIKPCNRARGERRYNSKPVVRELMKNTCSVRLIRGS